MFLGVEGSSWDGPLIVLLAAEPGSILLGRASIVKGVRALFIEDGVELKYVEDWMDNVIECILQVSVSVITILTLRKTSKHE